MRRSILPRSVFLTEGSGVSAWHIVIYMVICIQSRGSNAQVRYNEYLLTTITRETKDTFSH